jgi:transposase
MYRFVVGIDVSKKTLDISLYDQYQPTLQQAAACQISNDDKGFAWLDQWLEARGVKPSKALLCSEHTGRYGEALLRWTTSRGWPHAVVKTPALDKVGNEHDRKTDAYDAEGLAEYGCRYSDRLRLSEAPSAVVSQLKRLQAERRKMVSQRAGLKQKRGEADFHDASMETLLDMWDKQMALLSEHIDKLDQQIASLIEEHPALTRRYKLIRTAPGVGKVLGSLWLTLFGDQQQLNPRKIASRFGFAPHPHQSGSSVNRPARSSGFGKPEMRKVMHLAAQSVATHCEHYQEYYQRKSKEGKPHLLIINNIINKLIRLYCALWNKQTAYDPNHIKKMKEQQKKSA